MANGFTVLEQIIGDTYTDDITAGHRPLWCKYSSPMIYSRRRSDGLVGCIAWESIFIAQQCFRWDNNTKASTKSLSEAFSEWGSRTKQDCMVQDWIPMEITENGTVDYQAVKRTNFLGYIKKCRDCIMEECVQATFSKGLVTLSLPEPHNPYPRLRFHQDIVMEAVINPAGLTISKAEKIRQDMALLMEISETITRICSEKKSATNGR